MRVELICVIIGITGILIYIYYYYNNSTTEGIASVPGNGESMFDHGYDEVNKILDEEKQKYSDLVESTKTGPIALSNDTLDKFKWKNQSTNGPIINSYACNDRGGAPLGKTQALSNDGFAPMDETNGGYAAYSGVQMSPDKKYSPEEVFKVDKLLPQEVKTDWFDVMPEPIKVENRHLVNVTRPIGVNTIGTSHRNASHDIRGSPPCPKFVVSPWGQSTIDPDTNIKGPC